jgi:hypothetical protein
MAMEVFPSPDARQGRLAIAALRRGRYVLIKNGEVRAEIVAK